jgi:hypothetical protein
MTAPTVTPYRSGTPAGRDRFAHLLHAEWTKFRTVRGWVVAVIVAMLVTVLLGVYGGPEARTAASAARVIRSSRWAPAGRR